MDCNCKTVSIFKNDDTGAFRTDGKPFLRINRPSGLADDIDIYKLELKIANLPVFVFDNIVEEVPQPLVFPIDLNLIASQTVQLQSTNYCYIRVYDVNGLRQTCNGTITFNAKNEVV